MGVPLAAPEIARGEGLLGFAAVYSVSLGLFKVIVSDCGCHFTFIIFTKYQLGEVPIFVSGIQGEKLQSAKRNRLLLTDLNTKNSNTETFLCSHFVIGTASGQTPFIIAFHN